VRKITSGFRSNLALFCIPGTVASRRIWQVNLWYQLHIYMQSVLCLCMIVLVMAITCINSNPISASATLYCSTCGAYAFLAHQTKQCHCVLLCCTLKHYATLSAGFQHLHSDVMTVQLVTLKATAPSKLHGRCMWAFCIGCPTKERAQTWHK
jgi:hypothetical protein